MANFKICKNGHNYIANGSSVCPYCPSEKASTNYEKTMMDFKKTQLINDGNNQFARPVIDGETIDFGITPAPLAKNPFGRTSIIQDDDTNSTKQSFQQTEKRKLVGWLVSFSHDEFGQDYKLYAGKNKIGSAPGCDILIKDPSVSGDHTIILFRIDQFLIKDNFSTNGTIINGVLVDEGKLNDGDELKLGNTTFKFKSVF